MKRFNLFSNLWSSSGNSQSNDVSLDRRLTVGSPSALTCNWMLKFVSLLMLVFVVGVGHAWAYTITFKTSGTSSLINTGGDYATSTETAYVNGTSNGVQFGSGSKGGNILLTMTTSGQVKASTITLNGYCKLSSNGGNCKVTIIFTDNTTENHTPTATTTATNTDVAITNTTKTLKSIKLESTAKNKRFYVTGITVTEASSCSASPTVGTVSANGPFL